MDIFYIKRLTLLVSITLIASCGGSGESLLRIDEPTQDSGPELANASTKTYTAANAISTLSFTNSGGGSLTSCIADSLPSGLSVSPSGNSSTCVVSGTPTVTQTATTHSITATNATGSSTATVSIIVNSTPATLAAPTLANASAQTYTTTTAIAALSFTNSGGGSLTSCSADLLPTGLSVAVSSDSSTCEIAGIPTAVQAATTHTITATNSTGTDTVCSYSLPYLSFDKL